MKKNETTAFSHLAHLLRSESPLRNLFLVVLSATTLYFAQPGAGGTGWLAWVALIPFFKVLEKKRRFAAFGWGFVWGVAYHLPFLAWLRPFGPAAWLGLAIYQSLFSGLFGAFAATLLRRGGVVSIWSVAALWALTGKMTALLSFGIECAGLAPTQYLTPEITHLASWFGSVGLTFFVALGNAALGSLLGDLREKRSSIRSSPGAVALGFLFLLVALGAVGSRRLSHRLARAPVLVKIGLAQSNYGRALFTGAYSDPRATLTTYEALSEKLASEGCQAVLWPESAYPEELPNRNARLSRLARRHHLYLLAGGFDYAPPDKAYNSIYCFNPEGALVGVYHKRRLVPFGEFVPWRRYLPSLASLGVPDSDVSSGTGDGILDVGSLRIGMGICFESLFPELARTQAAHGARLLAIATNDSYYGRTPAPVSHEAMLLLRSVETGLPAIQAAATGYSLLALPDGTISAHTNLFERAALPVSIPDVGVSTTFWVRYSWLTWLALCGLTIAGFAPIRRLKRA